MLNKFFRPKLIVGTLPVTLLNGTTADATQVMSDLNWVVNQINANAAPLASPTFTGIVTTAAISATNITASGTLGVAGVASITNATASTSKTTGAVVVTGGIGIGGNSFLSSGFLSVDSANNTTTLKVGTTRTAAIVCIDAALESVITAVDIKSTQASTGGTFINFANSADAPAGSITHNGTTTVAYNTSSDERLKENFAPFVNPLDTVCAIKAGTFTWKEDGSLGNGCLAQQVYEIYPEPVHKGRTDEEMWSMDYAKFTPLLLGALQELNAKFEAYKAAHP